MSVNRRFILGTPPFRYLLSSLTRDDDFKVDIRTVLQVNDVDFSNFANELAGASQFLDSSRIEQIAQSTLQANATEIAKVVGRLSAIIHSSEMDVDAAMTEFSKALIENLTDNGFDVDEIKTFCWRVRKLVAEPAGISKHFKAARLAVAIGDELDDFQIVCDIRPVFDSKREKIEGAMPISLLRLDYSTADGDTMTVELRITDSQITSLADKLREAQKKNESIKAFLENAQIEVPLLKGAAEKEVF